MEGGVAILDKENAPVAFLGDNPRSDEWANHELKPGSIPPAFYSTAHGCFIDQNSDIYVSDWNQIGRPTKLTRKRARVKSKSGSLSTGRTGGKGLGSWNAGWY